ncbi:MAG: hypothetical protein ACLQUY_14380 [Ktedonobacterales bacterium]
MTKAMRWRIIALQVVMVLVLGFSAGGSLYASNFISTQIHDQLAPQQIFFPASAKQGLPSDLDAYAGQQVVNGDQAHAYAEDFIGLHLSEIGQGHPYSYWSGLARSTTNPALAAKDEATATTIFQGDTLQSMLNTAWTFWTIGQIAFVTFYVLLAAALIMLVTLGFEVYEAVRGKETVEAIVVTANGSVPTKVVAIEKESVSVN